VFSQLLSPIFCYRWIQRLWPVLAGFTLVLAVIGLVGGLFLAPPDYQQGQGFRIIYVHVPAAFLSLLTYTSLAICAGIYLIWRIKMADWVAASIAPVGALFTFLALVTGAIWGKPMWGTWWVWDARLTSELILLFLFLGYMALRSAMPDRDMARKTSSILAIVGIINVPIIHFSVVWWHTLHQGPTLSRLAKPTIEMSMLWPLLVMIACFGCYFLLMVMLRLRLFLIVETRFIASQKS
jgi:heme exporter protein C